MLLLIYEAEASLVVAPLSHFTYPTLPTLPILPEGGISKHYLSGCAGGI